MFSVEQKHKIADAVEKVLLELNHSEMPKEKMRFSLHVDGIELWSFADILPNWTFDNKNPPQTTDWNEREDACK